MGSSLREALLPSRAFRRQSPSVMGIWQLRSHRSSIGGGPENAPHGRPIPGRLAAAGPHALLLETPAHLADADALAADPREDPPHDPSLVLQDLVAGHAAVSLADIAIAIGRARQHADRTLTRGVALAAPAALQDLGPLVLGYHALDLQQQTVLRREADRSIEEDDLNPSPVELVDQQYLIGVAPRQSVGGVDGQAIEVAGRHGIAQTIEGGPHQGGSAVALVGKATLGHQGEAVLREAGLQRRDLAVNGVVGGLLFGRDAGVDGDAHGCHAHSLLVRSAVSGVVSRGEPHGSGRARSRRSTIGSRRSNASAMHCFSSRVTSWLTQTLRVGGFVLRRRIGASVIRPSHLGWPTQQQRRSQEAVAVLWSQTIPWDRHRQIERKFCT